MANVKAIPDGYHTITPAIVVKDAKRAIEFYARAFGAQDRGIFTGPDGRIMHAELQIGNSIFMLMDEMPEMNAVSPTTLKNTTASLYLYVENADAAFDRAVKAGATVKTPVADMFWGDRCGTVIDPFGYQWSIAMHKEDLTPQEIRTRGEQFFATQAKT